MRQLVSSGGCGVMRTRQLDNLSNCRVVAGGPTRPRWDTWGPLPASPRRPEAGPCTAIRVTAEMGEVSASRIMTHWRIRSGFGSSAV